MKNFLEFLIESEFRFQGNTLGIITAQNPKGLPHPKEDNEKANNSLWNDLRAKGYDPWHIKGKYAGQPEDSFIVPNISKRDLIRYAKKYRQVAVVFAKKLKKGYGVEWVEKGKTKKKQKIKNIRSLIARATEI